MRIKFAKSFVQISRERLRHSRDVVAVPCCEGGCFRRLRSDCQPFFSSSSLFFGSDFRLTRRRELAFSSTGGGTLLRTFSLSTTLQNFFSILLKRRKSKAFQHNFPANHPRLVGSTCSSANQRRRHSRTSDISAPPARRTRNPFSRGRSPTIVPKTSIVCHVPAASIRCGRT